MDEKVAETIGAGPAELPIREIDAGYGAQGAPSHDPSSGGTNAVCPVVGLGASAGGLEAFQQFMGAAPTDGGELLRRRTSM
jgi:chemotaxis response regulator CheB